MKKGFDYIRFDNIPTLWRTDKTSAVKIHNQMVTFVSDNDYDGKSVAYLRSNSTDKILFMCRVMRNGRNITINLNRDMNNDKNKLNLRRCEDNYFQLILVSDGSKKTSNIFRISGKKRNVRKTIRNG